LVSIVVRKPGMALEAESNVRNRDRTQSAKNHLLDHLVGPSGKWQRNGDAERFGGLEI